MNFILMAVCGILAGLLSGLFGVGGGVLMVPFFIYLLRLETHAAIGTSLAIIIPTALVGALKHYSKGALDIRVFIVVSIFALVGAYFGANISLGMAAPALRKAFAVFLFCFSIYMYLKG